MRGHSLYGNRAPIGDQPVVDERIVRDHGADDGMEPISADKQLRVIDVAIGKAHPDEVSEILDLGDFAPGFKRDMRLLATSVEQHIQETGPMDNNVGMVT